MPFIRTELTERAPAFFDLLDITISINSVFSVRQFIRTELTENAGDAILFYFFT